MKKATIKAANGLHARPAAEFVKLASECTGDVQLKKGDKAVSTKSIMRLMSLGIVQGDEVYVITEDEALAERLASFLDQME